MVVGLRILQCSGEFRDGLGKAGNTLNTSREGTNPLGPIVSLIPFRDSLKRCLSLTFGCSVFSTLKTLLKGMWYLSPGPMALCASMPLNWRLMPTFFA